MFTRRSSSRPSEDPLVAEVEAILDARASRHSEVEPRLKGRTLAVHALWICACMTIDDAPTWLIYDTGEKELMWCRVADGVEPHHLVDAQLTAGGHSDPDSVLVWLQGESSLPWHSDDGWGDGPVVQELGRQLRGP